MRKLFLTILIFQAGLLVFSQNTAEPPRAERSAVRLPEPGREKLGLKINTEFRESNPLISPDDRILYFVREDHPRNMGTTNLPDIWAAYRQFDGQWARAVNLGGPANNRKGNLLAGINSKGNQLYISNLNAGNQWLGVVRTTQTGRSWSIPRTLDIDPASLPAQAGDFFLSADNRTLFFTADNNGQKDIYCLRYEPEKGWSAAIELGPEINTRGTERAPYLAADGKTLYFSAISRTENYGGLDIYVSRRLDDSWTSWTPPQNLGAAINTTLDEYGCSIPAAGDYLYFSSGNAEEADIYRSFLPEEYRPEAVVLLSGKIINGETYETLPVPLNVKSFDGQARQPASVYNLDGSYHMLIPQGTNIGLYAEQEGYFPVSESMELSDEQLEELDQDHTDGMVAQVEEDRIYSYTNPEVEKLQLRLRTLDEDLREIERERKKANDRLVGEGKKRKLHRYNSFRSDPELDALRHRYQETLRQEAAVQYRREKSGDSPDLGTPDEELLALKRKFNDFYYPETAGVPGKNGTGTDPAIKPEEQEFLRLERKVLNQLKVELQFEVMRELQTELIEPELLKAEKTMPSFMKKMISRSLKSEVKNELKKMVDEREEAFLREKKNTESTAIEKELKKVLTPEVKSELKEQLTQQIRADIRRELTYQIKKEDMRQLTAELQVNHRRKKGSRKKKKSNAGQLSEGFTATGITELEKVEVEKNILLLPLREGQVIPLNNIFFEANTLVIKKASYDELERTLAFLRKYPGLYIEIAGHTNGWVTSGFAKSLSADRAEAIRDYFIANGIAPERLEYQGYGNSWPLASNATLSGRKKNQRIELRILRFEQPDRP